MKIASRLKKISVIIPIYNEAENIFELYRRLKLSLNNDFTDMDQEILFVDDGSTDQTVNLIKTLINNDPIVGLIKFSRNFGHSIAISAGLDYSDGDFVVTMDGDLQDQPEEMIRLYNKLKEGYDVVLAERYNRKVPVFKLITSYIFLHVMRFLINEDISIYTDVYRIMTRQVVKEVRRCRESNRYILGLISWVGFNQATVAVEQGKRFRGSTKFNWYKLVGLAKDAIFSFSDYPLRLITKCGFLLVVFSFLMGSYVIYRRIMFGIDIIGWPSLMTSIFFMGGVQIFILGMIGEYLGRVFMESKKRPLYIVKDVILNEKSLNLLDRKNKVRFVNEKHFI